MLLVLTNVMLFNVLYLFLGNLDVATERIKEIQEILQMLGELKRKDCLSTKKEYLDEVLVNSTLKSRYIPNARQSDAILF